LLLNIIFKLYIRNLEILIWRSVKRKGDGIGIAHLDRYLDTSAVDL